MEGLWQLLFLASQCDLESLTEDLNFMFTQMQFIHFFLLCHLKSSECTCVGMRTTRKKSMIWPTMSEAQYSFHVLICFFDMVLVCYNPLWHLPQNVSGWYSASCFLNAKYFCPAFLAGAMTDCETRNMMPWFLHEYCVFCRVWYHQHHLP